MVGEVHLQVMSKCQYPDNHYVRSVIISCSTFSGKVFPLEVGDTFVALEARVAAEEHRCPR